MASSALKQLFTDVEWGKLDYLIVDLPPGTSDIHITLSQNFNITGTIIISKAGNFFCTLLILPTGIVDRIITVGFDLEF